MNPDDFVASINAQLYSVTSRKDGGGRIQFEFGMDSLIAIHRIQMWNAKGGMNFTLAIVPTDLMERMQMAKLDHSPELEGESESPL